MDYDNGPRKRTILVPMDLNRKKGGKQMYHVLKVHIGPKDKLYTYCDAITHAANNLRNAALFRTRQVLTMVDKSYENMTDNEREVYNELQMALPLMGKKYSMPSKGNTFLGYEFLDSFLKNTNNPDYYCKELPRQSAQQTLKGVAKDMKSFYALCRTYKENPDLLNEKPQLPHYGKPGGNHTVELSNQDCVVYEISDAHANSTANGGATRAARHEVKLPRTKIRLDLGEAPVPGRLKQAAIIPTHGIFVISLTFDDGNEPTQPTEQPKRVCSIDIGVDNLAAMTNNLGEPCLLFKGGVVKSVNQHYNKQMAKLVSEQTKGTDKKFQPTPESRKLELWRENHINDFMHKTAATIVDWCKAHRVDTLIVGVNKGWKQECHMGHVNNQNFVMIPFAKFRFMLQYRCQRAGIAYVEQEESYTSKASFVDRDFIPTYGHEGAHEQKFSGSRIHRGVYRTKNKQLINADLNGSANIARKAFPDIFDREGCQPPDFFRVEIIRHPYGKTAKYANHGQKPAGPKPISKAKHTRLVRKARKANSTSNSKVIPMG